MAKKGGVQQLQADISTDEDFEKFLERPGLLVMDVYSEWCGPCLGMVGSLKKIKLELGGDNLQLAICKSDTITALKRFNKKSEPTWLFVTHGKSVNLMFGTNVPKLMKLIARELELLSSKAPRPMYSLTELQPEEVERKRKVEDALAEAERIELAEKEKQRRSYLMYVTDTIMENMPEIGVTLFGPQVNRDMFKKIMEPADVHKIQCKDRRVQVVTRENFDVVNFDCPNRLDEEVIEQLDNKELLLCFWKMPEEGTRSVPETLQMYAHDLTKTTTVPLEEGEEEERVIPPIIAPLDVKVEVELQDGEEWHEEEDAAPAEDAKRKAGSDEVTAAEEAVDEELAEGDAEAEGEGGEAAEEPADIGGMPDFGIELDTEEADAEEKEEPEPVVEEPPKKRTRIKTVKIPPIWVPSNQRTHAALIYVFFRAQTAPFLPPDPVPEPPHVVMAFDAYKKKDLLDLAGRHKDEVLLYGFFTSDDADEAKFIANSSENYATQAHTASDKIVFKVSKQTSHTMLSMATYGPSYVSPNTVIGKEEALKFFPENYKTAAQEALEMAEQESEEPKKRKKSKKRSTTAITSEAEGGSDTGLVGEKSEAAEDETPEEGAVTTSGEESGDSMPAEAAAADGEVPAGEEVPAEAEPTDAAAPEEPAADSAPPPEEPAAPPPEE